MKTKNNELYLCAGIDVSKETLDVYYNTSKGEHYVKLSNNLKGYNKLVELVGVSSHYVMESTGPYNLKLAFFLQQRKCKVSIENSLVIKRFIQMNKERNKSDKKDARWIFQYGILQQPMEWTAPSKIYLACVQIQNTIDMLSKQRTMISNLLHSMEHSPLQDKKVIEVLAKQMKAIDNAILKMEKELELKIESWVPNQLKNLQTIPGMGKRTASQLIIFTDGFTKVSNYRQLISLSGLSPKEFSSGSSIKGRVRICKMGGATIRNLLYMCSMSAIKKNKACKELFERLKAKGKNGKLALIAVCNKLLKQAFAIATKGVKYQEDYIVIKN